MLQNMVVFVSYIQQTSDVNIREHEQKKSVLETLTKFLVAAATSKLCYFEAGFLPTFQRIAYNKTQLLVLT